MKKINTLKIFTIGLSECLDILKNQSIFVPHFAYKLNTFMYAIVDIAGKQFKVTKDQFVYAPYMAGEAGASVEFDNVLLIDNAGAID